MASSSSPPPPKVVVEYAKSGRSSCKQCRKSISAGSLRLGFAGKDPRGFDLTKWHHIDCFPRKTEGCGYMEGIKGFSSLQKCDQEALKKLEVMPASDQADINEDLRDSNLEKDGNKKSIKVRRASKFGVIEFEETSLKKSKLSQHDMQLDVMFSDSEVKNKYKEATLPSKWKAFQTIIFCEKDDNLHGSNKIAAFDFDGCLVNTSVKITGPNAWSLLYPSIPEKLQSLYGSGYKLVIFTNESNIERWKNKRQQAVDSKIGRLDNFVKLVKVPLQIFIACGLGKSKDRFDDPFRKPNVGMWKIMKDHFNSGIPIDMDQSFYVGDAAGRVNDHSDADVKFAQAIGLKFYLPEEYFNT